MSLTDHVAILTQCALASAVPNKKKPTAPLQFYALIAFPPAAGADLNATLQAVAAQHNFAIRFGVTKIGVVQNAMRPDPLPGIPADWLVVRASTQFAPDLFDESATLIDRAALDFSSATRARFFAGKRVRVQISPYYWAQEGGGLSWNLHAVMDAGEGGDRIAGIGGGADQAAFAKHAVAPAAKAAPANNPFAAATPQPAAQAPHHNTHAAPAASTTAANPFAQQAASANPFAPAQTAAAGDDDIPY